jgi:hypothetical protein
MRQTRIAALVISFFASLLPLSAQTFSDTTFNNGGWVSVLLPNSVSGSSFTAGQDLVNGNPAPSRATTHSYPFGSIFVAHLSQPSVYVPSIQGAISSLSYRYDVSHRTAGAVAYSLLVFQNNTYYRASEDVITGSGWTPFNRPGLTATDFTKLSGPTQSDHPDFTCRGARIVLGYVTRNTNSNPGTTDNTDSGIDNWRAHIEPTPCCAAVVEPRVTCDLGIVTYSFTVTNTSANVIHHLLLSPPPGATYTITPRIIDLSPPLQSNDSANVTVTITNATPGMPICIDVLLAGEDLVACCKVTTCLDAPACPCLRRVSQTIECGSPGFIYTAQIQNLTGSTINELFVVPISPPGVTVTPQVIPVTIPNNATATVQLTITGAPFGSKVCLRLVPAGDDAECCSVEICIDVPERDEC